MTEVKHVDSLPHATETVWDWLIRPGAAARFLGGSQATSQVQGTELALVLWQSPGASPLILRTASLTPRRELILEQVEGPFRRFRLRLSLTPGDGETCQLESALDHAPGFALRLRPGIRLRGGENDARRWLKGLHGRFAADLARHDRYADRYAGRGGMRIAVSGASGLVGRRLCDFLSAGGHTVVPMTRSTGNAGRSARAPGRGTGGLEGGGEARQSIAWNPATGELDAEALEGMDAVVHLAGAGIADGRWNPSRKSAILDSRIQGTALLAHTLAGLANPPRVLLSASAIGYYGHTGDTPVDEDAPPGTGFLAGVCHAWEDALEPAEQAGIRTVRLRTGMVLAREGGALGAMLPAFRLGLGGPLGSGRQFQSWIAMEDMVTLMHRALHEEGWRGPCNAVAPEPVRQKDFARSLGRVLGRPAIAPLPALAVRALFGEMGQALLLEGQRVSPARLKAWGFDWAQPTLEEALKAELD